MLKNISRILFFCLFGLLVQCRSPRFAATNKPVTAQISKEGFLSCFEKDLKYSDNNYVWCEASAILYDGTNLFLANDKEMPGSRSSVFYWPFKQGFADTSLPATYIVNSLLKKGKKFEDFALTPNGKYVFLSTAFDRFAPGNRELDGYNIIYYWMSGHPDNPHIMGMYPTDTNSVSLRDKLSKVLRDNEFPRGVPYFKVEGFAATDDILYFGIREKGKKYDDFTYQCKIITVGYRIKNGIVQLIGDFSLLADIDIPSLQPELEKPLGLSSIEYDRFNKRFMILTSYENGQHLGGHLWTASLGQLRKNQMELVKDYQGKALVLNHKTEDIAIIDKHTIIIVNDDDRQATSVNGQVRQPFQCAYDVVRFK